MSLDETQVCNQWNKMYWTASLCGTINPQCKVFLTFKSVDGTLVYDHPTEIYQILQYFNVELFF